MFSKGHRERPGLRAGPGCSGLIRAAPRCFESQSGLELVDSPAPRDAHLSVAEERHFAFGVGS